MERTLDLNQLEKLADRFKILSEASRLRILQAICQEERSVSEICDYATCSLRIALSSIKPMFPNTYSYLKVRELSLVAELVSVVITALLI